MSIEEILHSFNPFEGCFFKEALTTEDLLRDCITEALARFIVSTFNGDLALIKLLGKYLKVGRNEPCLSNYLLSVWHS